MLFCSHEAKLAAKKEEKSRDPRFPRPSEDEDRPPRHPAPHAQRPRAPFSVNAQRTSALSGGFPKYARLQARPRRVFLAFVRESPWPPLSWCSLRRLVKSGPAGSGQEQNQAPLPRCPFRIYEEKPTLNYCPLHKKRSRQSFLRRPQKRHREAPLENIAKGPPGKAVKTE